jgi:arylsulfatase B
MVAHTTRLAIFLALALALLTVAGESVVAQDAAPPNFLLLIGDDMSVETLNCYGVGSRTAHTPNIDRLCDQGVRFDNFWAQPVCSPTRATMLTGQYGFRNGVGTPASAPTGVNWNAPTDNSGHVDVNGMGAGMAGGMGMGAMGAPQAGGRTDSRPALRPDAWTMLQALKLDESAGYATAAVGKWHLANNANGGLSHPNRVGFDHYAGSIPSGVESFYAWSKVVDGADPFGTTNYATTENVDDGIAWLLKRGNEPWFLWVAFNAPHTPIQLPPKELLSSQASLALDPDGKNGDEHAYFNAMIEAMDTEIGRLLEDIGEEELANTFVIFMGDNGTENSVISPPFVNGKAKATVYQGGVSVPFIITGPGLEAGSSNNELANSVDVFATVLELAGSDAATTKPEGVFLDTVSMVPILSGGRSLRDFNYADHFGATRTGASDERAIRNARYKLIQDRVKDTEELYDLVDDPYEQNDLLQGEPTAETTEHYESLKARIEALVASG